jgi:4-amino-4-deoxy-L-arabinose transferase-like glycosyltransferase
MTVSETVKTGPASFIKKHWYLLALALICLLSFGLNFFAIGEVGFGNAYYAAAIRSMTQRFSNFFFVSFDPAGFVSVDKPPLGLWVQVLFVSIFGYHGWAMLLPQALAATGGALLMYALTSKHFGRPAGLVASLIFAITPAVVVSGRNNTMDAQLVLVLLAGAWFLFKSIETSKRRYLFICAVFIGLGFNIKMLEAYMILPAAVTVYLIFDRQPFMKRIASGLLGFVMMLAVSSVWAVAVELTPPDSRPYVDSTSDNTMAQLIVGHNGLDRLLGAGKTAGAFGMTTMTPPAGAANWSMSARALPPQPYSFTAGFPNHAAKPASWTSQMSWADITALTAGNAAGVNQNDIGHPGLLRFWDSGLFGQITWLFVLLPFCLIALFGKVRQRDLRMPRAALVFWVAWLVTMLMFFSAASFWHRYYLCVVAPAVAGLSAAGLPELFRAFRKREGWKQFLLPLALLCTVTPELLYIAHYDALRSWLAPLTIVLAAAALLLMAFYWLKPILPSLKKPALYAAEVLMLTALLAGPFYWSLTAVLYVAPNATLPYAGPELVMPESRFTTPNQEALTTGDSGTMALEKYLVAHYKPGSFLVVAQRANDVAEFIVDTGLPAMAYGGFLGTDKALTLDSLKDLVARGRITYFLISWKTAPVNSELNAYVWEHARLVEPSEYLQGASDAAGAGRTQNGIAGDALFLFS